MAVASPETHHGGVTARWLNSSVFELRLLLCCSWVEGGSCGGGVVECGGQGWPFIGRGELGAVGGGHGVVWARRGRHGDMRGRRRAGQGRTRARARGVKGGAARAGAVGAGSGGCWSAGVAAVHACPQGVRHLVGRQCNGECGQGEGPWCEGLAWGASRGQWQAPGHGGSQVCCWLGQGGMVDGMSMAWQLRLGS